MSLWLPDIMQHYNDLQKLKEKAETLEAGLRLEQTHINQMKLGLPAEGNATGSKEEMGRIKIYFQKVEEQHAMTVQLLFITQRIAFLVGGGAAGMGGGGGDAGMGGAGGGAARGNVLRPGDRTWTY